MSASSSSSSSSSVHIATLGLVGGVRIRSVARVTLLPLPPSPSAFRIRLIGGYSSSSSSRAGVAAESNQFIRLIRRGQSIIPRVRTAHAHAHEGLVGRSVGCGDYCVMCASRRRHFDFLRSWLSRRRSLLRKRSTEILQTSSSS